MLLGTDSNLLREALAYRLSFGPVVRDLRFSDAQACWKEQPYRRPHAWGRDRAAYLVDAIALRRCYRKHFLAGLGRLRTRDELKLHGDFQPLCDDKPWAALMARLQATEWVSYIEPPSENCRPEHVLKYLARSLTGGLRQIADRVKPSWGQVMNSSSRPNWYARRRGRLKPCLLERPSNRICKR